MQPWWWWLQKQQKVFFLLIFIIGRSLGFLGWSATRSIWMISALRVRISIGFLDAGLIIWESGFTKMEFSMLRGTVWEIARICLISKLQELSSTVLSLFRIWRSAQAQMAISMSGRKESWQKGKTLIQGMKCSVFTLQPIPKYLHQEGPMVEWSSGRSGQVW